MWLKIYSIWLKTEQETIISKYNDFTKIAPTVPLCTVRFCDRPVQRFLLYILCKEDENKNLYHQITCPRNVYKNKFYLWQ